MKKPTVLYWYENRKVMKHKLEPDCIPQLIGSDSQGERWRCKHDRGGDYYGYTKLAEAKALEIQQTGGVCLEALRSGVGLHSHAPLFFVIGVL